MADEPTPDTGASTTVTTDTGTATTTTTVEPDTDTEPDLAKEVDKWKALARKQEERAKANAGAAKELERLRAETMTETERLVDAARKEALAEAAKGFGARLVDAELKAAAAGRSVDVDALLEGLDRARFLTDDGEPDSAAIAAWVDRIAPARTDTGPGAPDLGQGIRPGAPALNEDALLRDLKSTLGIR